MAVLAKLVDGTIQLRPETSDDRPLADYLLGVIKGARNLAKGADDSTVAKAGLSGLALVRKAQEERLEVLKDQAEVWENRSRDWSLTKEIRDLNSSRARSAREEVRRIAADLGE